MLEVPEQAVDTYEIMIPIDLGLVVKINLLRFYGAINLLSKVYCGG